MGDAAVYQFVISIQFLPMVKMFVLMCPEGAEGSSYAMLTTMSNLALSLASSLSAGALRFCQDAHEYFAHICFLTVVSKFFDVSKDALNAHQWSGMWKLTIVCAAGQLLSMVFIPILPSGIEEQTAMVEKDESNETAGKVFIGVLVSSLLLVVITAIVTLAST